MKQQLMTGAFAAAVGLMGMASVAQAEPAVVATGPGGYVVQYAPPPPMYEIQPAARDGFVWAPGHYEWRNGRYSWVAGSWLRDRPGYEWREARWIQRSDGSWLLSQGDWIRADRYSAYDERRNWRRGPNGDRDGDGLRNRDDGDRDGDGVMNWRDNYPNNPNRS